MSHTHSDVIKSLTQSDTILLSHIELKLREGCITRHVNTLLPPNVRTNSKMDTIITVLILMLDVN